MGALVGNLVVFLRTRHKAAVGLNEFLSLGLVAVADVLAQLSLASGFLAAFAAGLALHRVKERRRSGTRSLEVSSGTRLPTEAALATDSHHASAAMTLGV